MQLVALLAKTESTFNTDAVPTPALNAMMARVSSPTPISAEFADRPLMRGHKGNFGKLAVGAHREIDVEVELAGSGAAGTAPKWAPLLMACGFSETLTASTSAVYNLISSGDPSLTLYSYLDGLLFKMTGARGTASFDFNAKGVPVMKCKFFGEYSAASDAAFPTGLVWTGWQKPLTVGKVNTPTFTVQGFTGVCQALSVDLSNELSWQDKINAAYAWNADRDPSGSFTLELPTAAAWNVGEVVRLGTEGALQLVHGTTAGNIIQLDAPKLQLVSAPNIGNNNKLATVSANFTLNPNAGNDELVITVK
jgi:hypothetical protein